MNRESGGESNERKADGEQGGPEGSASPLAVHPKAKQTQGQMVNIGIDHERSFKRHQLVEDQIDGIESPELVIRIERVPRVERRAPEGQRVLAERVVIDLGQGQGSHQRIIAVRNGAVK